MNSVDLNVQTVIERNTRKSSATAEIARDADDVDYKFSEVDNPTYEH